jgi:2,5-diketo-D-gluconate reductase A
MGRLAERQRPALPNAADRKRASSIADRFVASVRSGGRIISRSEDIYRVDAVPTAQPRQPIRLTLLRPIKGEAPCNPKNSELRSMDTPDIVLNDGNVIPQIGLGVWTLNADETLHSLENAIAAGYRHFDTAMIYRNESAVGRSIASASVPREELFVTTKLWNSDHGYDATLFAYEASLKRLGLKAIELYLIHWPVPAIGRFVESWRAMIRLRDEGRVRSIGVCNFNADHLDRLITNTGVTPAVNQIEIHPDFPQNELVRQCRSLGIHVEAWSPLGQGGQILRSPIIARIAERHRRTSAQIILRWHVEQGFIVIPRSRNAERIRENITIFDFAFDDEDRAALETLANGRRIGPDPDIYNDLQA